MISLHFDPQKSFVGTFTDQGITYDAYRVTYCAKPITGLTWDGVPSEEFFKLNIKVPSGLSGEQKRNAQILIYNPWGGDMGHPAAEPETLNNKQKVEVLKAGWILIEPGMRGHNCFTGTIGQPDFRNYGKLPRPLADLKAAIRYLRYEENVDTIPGNKDHIWIAGTSSGGCASSIIGTSGDSELFAPYLEEIGAADTSDAVYGSSPSCPVQNRSNGDIGLAWERWGDLNDDTEADSINRMLSAAFPPYLNSLKLRAEESVHECGIEKGDLLTDTNMKDYIHAYIRKAAVKFFSGKTQDEIDEYLASEKPGDRMYGSTPMPRNWIKPVYDEQGNVIDIAGTYTDFWRYTCGEKLFDRTKQINWQYDKPMIAPDELQEGNAIVTAGIGYGFTSAWGMPSSYSFGKPGEFAGVYSEIGQKYLTEQRGIEISDEYRELLAVQRNSVNPLYFALDCKGQTKIAERWFIRTGTVDMVTIHPLFIGLGTALKNLGKDVDLAFVWDQVHGLTDEIDEFMMFAAQRR